MGLQRADWEGWQTNPKPEDLPKRVPMESSRKGRSGSFRDTDFPRRSPAIAQADIVRTDILLFVEGALRESGRGVRDVGKARDG